MTTSRDRPYHVLFLCAGNSARSILAESRINHWGRGGFDGLSGGSTPKGYVHPTALSLLQQMELPTAGLRSKSWDEFAAPGAPPLDFVFTVCDKAAGEPCPIWPGQPVTAHWGVPDPALVAGTDDENWAAFSQTLSILGNRIRAFLNLPLASFDRLRLETEVREVGRTP